MKKLLLLRGVAALFLGLVLAFCLPTACKRDKDLLSTKLDGVSVKVDGIRKWWQNRKINEPPGPAEVSSRIPVNLTIQDYWRLQFQNGIPKWSDARVFTIGDENIYEVPFQFPDNLVLLNDKPDAAPQLFFTEKEGSGEIFKTSRTYLVVKEKHGVPTVAEIMCVVLHNPYVRVLDSLNMPYPEIHINNLYPSVNNIGEFSGSVKFFNTDGRQLLEEGFTNGILADYVQYGQCNFLITPTPALETTRTYQVCTWTYVYQQNCAPDAGCTDWELIGVIFNGCQTIVTPDSPPVILTPFDGAGGGGGSYPEPPSIEQNLPIPNADLCGKYIWKRVGASHTAQIKNLGVEFVWTGSNGSSYSQSVILGWVCVEYPKWVSDQGYDISGFVNRAYNLAKWKVLSELNTNVLPGASAAIQSRFKLLMTTYINETGAIHVGGASIAYHNGCAGDVPVSQPRWCPPVQ
jgi:hypothetical protein